MNEYMYNYSTWLIALILLVSLFLANELGYRCARRFERNMKSAELSQNSAIQASILGLLALLLGFSFTMALQRFDHRGEALVHEANAIGTAQLRIELLPPSAQPETYELFSIYLQTRVDAGANNLTQTEIRDALYAQAEDIQQQLWLDASALNHANPSPTTTGLYLQALNEMFDAFALRNAALDRHVPEAVFFLLFLVLVLANGVVGYGYGSSARRPLAISYLMATLIVLVIFMVIDLDRPRRGIIQVNQAPLTELVRSAP